MSDSYLDILPVEILYRIFDNLDIETIVCSIRYVCKQFYLTTNTYNRYRFDFQRQSKRNFQLICRLIPFENVISLTLSNQDPTYGQIPLFFSQFTLEKFHRLQNLTFIQIDDELLVRSEDFIRKSHLKTLSITLHTYPTPKTFSSAKSLSSLIAHRTVEHLDLHIGLRFWNDLEWPNDCQLQSLRINTNITLDYLQTILKRSIQLKNLNLKDVLTDEDDNEISVQTGSQLKSLTFTDGRITLIKLEQCLSLTPSLTYLKLIGSSDLFNSTFDGLLWQKLIQTKLISLKTFEVFLSILTYSNYPKKNLDLLIKSFRTCFWLEQLNCSIQCDYIPNSRKIMFYTLPICHRNFVYPIDIKKISLTNFSSRSTDNDMINVQKLSINLTKDVQTSVTQSMPRVFFPNIKSLTLGNDDEWPSSAQRFLSTILNLSQITKLSLSVNFFPDYSSNTISHINSLLSQTSNLHSLILYDYWTPENCSKRLPTVCSLIRSNIKHLQLRVKDLNDITYILDRLGHLTSITFEYAQMLTIDREEFLQSLDYLNRYSSIWDCQNSLHVWFGDKKT